MQPRVDNLLPFFKALADESRLKIVGILAAGELSVRDLAARLELREPTVSHHLAILKALDLVRLRVDGNVHWYRLNQDVLKTLRRLAATNLRAPAPSAGRRSFEDEVLHNFLAGERLREIPVSRKKRWVILKWLAARFDPGTTYTEADVNRLLKRHHPDTATLRRDMIGYRMLARARGLYRRLPESEWHRE